MPRGPIIPATLPEIDWILRRLHRQQPTGLHAAGVSLGGNALLRGPGERAASRRNGQRCRPKSPARPLPPAVPRPRLQQSLYRHFLSTLKTVFARLRHVSGLSTPDARGAQSLHQFDDAVTARLLWLRRRRRLLAEAPAKPFLKPLPVPALAVNRKTTHFCLPPACRQTDVSPRLSVWNTLMPAAMSASSAAPFRQSGLAAATPLLHFSSFTKAPHHEPTRRNLQSLRYPYRRQIPDRRHRPPSATPMARSPSDDRGQKCRLPSAATAGFPAPGTGGALMDGICAAGCDAIDVGCVPTPVTYFAAHELGCNSCVSVTGSHNPPDYNGLKMVIGGGTLALDAIQACAHRTGEPGAWQGESRSADVRTAYASTIVGDVAPPDENRHGLRQRRDAGASVAPNFSRASAARSSSVFARSMAISQSPSRSHPRPENLADVIRSLRRKPTPKSASPSTATATARRRHQGWRNHLPDRQLMLFAADVLRACPAARSSTTSNATACWHRGSRQHGGVPLMWNTGHALVRPSCRRLAPAGWRNVRPRFFKERWYGFDDGLYSSARLLEILSRSG